MSQIHLFDNCTRVGDMLTYCGRIVRFDDKMTPSLQIMPVDSDLVLSLAEEPVCRQCVAFLGERYAREKYKTYFVMRDLNGKRLCFHKHETISDAHSCIAAHGNRKGSRARLSVTARSPRRIKYLAECVV